MTAETGVKWLLRFVSVTTIPAFVAAVMPQSWLAYLLDKAEPGISAGIPVTYMARGLMGMYALVGLQCAVFSTDIQRYRPLITILGVCGAVATLVGVTALVIAVPPVQRTCIFWIVFADLAEGFVHTALLAILILCVPRHECRLRHTPPV